MKKPVPYDFLLDYLPANVVIKPAIGMFYIYFEGKIVLIFRKVGKNPQHNGIWLATRREDHVSLKTDVPAVTDFVFGEDEAFEPNWLQLKEDYDDFEEAAIAICELVARRDKRIGKPTPKAIQFTTK
jgi:chloramphenicol O-acetyltransferase